MSSSYSANQFDRAFTSQRLQNWCETKRFKERPTAQQGHTTFIANDRGHLLPGVEKRGSAWPDFKGTWDLPARIPVRSINPTGRSVEGLSRLKLWGLDPDPSARPQPHGGSRVSDRLQDDDRQVCLQDGAAAEVPSASQNCPVTGDERSSSQNQYSVAALVESACPTKRQEMPTSRPPTGMGTKSRPDSGKGQPANNGVKTVASQGKHQRQVDAL